MAAHASTKTTSLYKLYAAGVPLDGIDASWSVEGLVWGIAIPLLEMRIGLAELIGIPDLAKPALGDSVALRSDE